MASLADSLSSRPLPLARTVLGRACCLWAPQYDAGSREKDGHEMLVLILHFPLPEPHVCSHVHPQQLLSDPPLSA